MLDFMGNFFFNIFGNIVFNLCVGLFFIDYVSYDLLYIVGQVELIFDGFEVDVYVGV